RRARRGCAVDRLQQRPEAGSGSFREGTFRRWEDAMVTRFVVFIATSLDGFIARSDGGLDWLKPFEGEGHGYASFFAGVDALASGRGSWDTVLGFPDWPYGDKRVIVCTSRPASPAHGEEIWSGSPRALAVRLVAEGVRRVYLDGGALIRSFLREGLVDELTI